MALLRIVNGFEIVKHQKVEGQYMLIEVRYLKSGDFLTSSRYKDVSERKVEKVREKLEDYIKTNILAENQCQSIPLLTTIHEVERVIYDR